MTEPRRRVLMLHTGGTLGMQPREPDRALAPDEIGSTILEHIPELEQIAEIETRVICNLDSSDIGSEHWTRLSDEIAGSIDRHDGFVITHGTDTMAYSAAALSYRLRNLPKPVIFTGSVRPLADVRTDGRGNLIGAVDIATRDIPEVCIYFDGFLLRGNRATKSSSFAFHAFTSPCFSPLAELGTNLRLQAEPLRPSGQFRCEGSFEPAVAAVRVLPGGLGLTGIERIVESGTRGLLVNAFGSGNLPVVDRTAANALAELRKRDVVVVISSQAVTGSVNLDQYVGGRLARSVGAVGVGDMTIEAASVKLMYLLGTLKRVEDVRSAFASPLAGELT